MSLPVCWGSGEPDPVRLPRFRLRQIQSVFNCAAQVVANIPRYPHIHLKIFRDTLHWLPVTSRCRTYTVFNHYTDTCLIVGTAPGYPTPENSVFQFRVSGVSHYLQYLEGNGSAIVALYVRWRYAGATLSRFNSSLSPHRTLSCVGPSFSWTVCHPLCIILGYVLFSLTLCCISLHTFANFLKTHLFN